MTDHALQTAEPVAGPLRELDRAIGLAKDRMLELQHADGHWCATLEGGSITESEYILMSWILGREHDPDLPGIARSLRALQADNGGWLLFPGGPPDISATVQGYFALKLSGDAPDEPHMARARALIRELGGAERINTFTRFYLACLRQVRFEAVPSIPPELVYLPGWVPVSLPNMAAWTRTMVLPLGLVTTLRPRRELPAGLGIDELYLSEAERHRLSRTRIGPIPNSWEKLFLLADRVVKLYEKSPVKPGRRAAIRRAERWMHDHLRDSDGIGAIFPPMVYTLVVFHALGYPEDHPAVVKGHQDLKAFFVRTDRGVRVQPCFSPGWDTGIALHALAEGVVEPGDDAAERAASWLLGHEVRMKSDWADRVRGVEPGAWAFEYANPHYPDTDDTAMAVASLRRLGGERARGAVRRGRAWLLAMQNDDGGWAAFDRTKDRPILEKVPFADHNAMQDPSCPDITGRVLEALGHTGLTADEPAGRRAIAYLKKQQDADGSWWGRWGVNYTYGTWQVLVGLEAIGENMAAGYVRRAGAWLKSVQRADGGFGETADSYRDKSLKGRGTVTSSQTAWGAMGLLAVFGPEDDATRRAMRWLIEHQREDGSWNDDAWTGTGFPLVYYLKYHMYPMYFPLMALARWRRLVRTRA